MEQAEQVSEDEEMEDYEEADLEWYHNEVIVESEQKKFARNRRLTTLNAFSVLAIWLYCLVQQYICWKGNPPYELMLIDYTSVNLFGLYGCLGVCPKDTIYRSCWQVTIIVRIVGTAVFVYIVVTEGYEDLYTISSAATAVAMIGVVALIYPIPIEDPIDPIDEILIDFNSNRVVNFNNIDGFQ